MKKECVGPEKYIELLKSLKVPLSPAVRLGNFLFVSGQFPVDPDTGTLVSGNIEEQTRAVLDNLKEVLEAGGSSLDKVLRTTVYATNAAFYGRINEVYRQYFPKDYPARTFVTVGSFPLEFDVEIECIAYIDEQR